MTRTSIEESLMLKVLYRQQPCGITEKSKTYYKQIRKRLGSPFRVYLVYIKDPSWDFLTYVKNEKGEAAMLDGFAWGYAGEGPRGLEWLFNEIGFQAPKNFPNPHQEGAWCITPTGLIHSA